MDLQYLEEEEFSEGGFVRAAGKQRPLLIRSVGGQDAALKSSLAAARYDGLLIRRREDGTAAALVWPSRTCRLLEKDESYDPGTGSSCVGVIFVTLDDDPDAVCRIEDCFFMDRTLHGVDFEDLAGSA